MVVDCLYCGVGGLYNVVCLIFDKINVFVLLSRKKVGKFVRFGVSVRFCFFIRVLGRDYLFNSYGNLFFYLVDMIFLVFFWWVVVEFI